MNAYTLERSQEFRVTLLNDRFFQVLFCSKIAVLVALSSALVRTSLLRYHSAVEQIYRTSSQREFFQIERSSRKQTPFFFSLNSLFSSLSHPRNEALSFIDYEMTEKPFSDQSKIQEVEFNGQIYQAIKEGQATMLFRDKRQVFYNPAMETNRDLSIAMANVFHSILEDEKTAPNSYPKSRCKDPRDRLGGMIES